MGFGAKGYNVLWVLTGGYLIYLGVQLFLDLFRGEASLPPVNIAAGVLFIAVGALLEVREWKNYCRFKEEAARAAEEGEDPENDGELPEGEDPENDGELPEGEDPERGGELPDVEEPERDGELSGDEER